MTQPLFFLVLLFSTLPAALRLVEHEWNLVPAGALALFAGVHFRDKRWAYAAPLLALFATDVALGIQHRNPWHYTFHPLLPVVLFSYAAYVGLGRMARVAWLRADAEPPRKLGLKKRLVHGKILPTAAAGFGGALVFFLVTNFFQFLLYHNHTIAELRQCYAQAVPFFRNSLASDAIFGTALFVAFAIASRLLQPSDAGELDPDRL